MSKLLDEVLISIRYQPGGFVHEGDGRRTDNTESQWKEEAHKKDHERVEAAKLMLAKRQKSNEGGADVNAN